VRESKKNQKEDEFTRIRIGAYGAEKREVARFEFVVGLA